MGLESLPPDYTTEEHKQQFRFFIEHYGTSFATSATLGGRVEQYSSFKSWMTNPAGADGISEFSIAKLMRNAQIDFTHTTGLPGPSGGHDPGYDDARRTLEPLACLGGDSTTSCQSNFSGWENTIRYNPVLLDYELAPISDLVADPVVKASLNAAVNEYVAEKTQAWAAVNKCPPSCSGVPGASCPVGASACRCIAGRVGRMCSGCSPTAVKGTFTGSDGRTVSTQRP